MDIKSLDPKGVAEMIQERIGRKIPLSTVYNWLSKGVIKARKIGGSWVVFPSSVEFFLSDPAGENKPDCFGDQNG